MPQLLRWCARCAAEQHGAICVQDGAVDKVFKRKAEISKGVLRPPGPKARPARPPGPRGQGRQERWPGAR
eukprot:11168407-Lingulodinium_polyedra.AAC.1